MKKFFVCCGKPAALFFLLNFIFFHCLAQNKTTTPQKNPAKQITITISGIDYDDAAFVKLRETIKQNVKVTEVNPGYSAGTAKMSILFKGKATELWDELPQGVKQPFSITAIDDKQISLQKNTVKQTDTVKPTTTKKEEDCLTCIYHKVCNYDTSMVFDGITFKGQKSGTQKGFYYQCINGALLRKFLDAEKKYLTQTLFKANEPVGTSWSYPIDKNQNYSHVTVAKGVSITVKGTNYSDVMIVYNDYNPTFRNDYYAKDVGLVKSDTLTKNYNPFKAIAMKGTIDKSIAGLWKHHNTVVDMNMYYRFNGDGTYEYYAGAVHPVNQMPKGKSYWRLNGEVLELYNTDWNETVKITLQKKSDPTTGKPTLLIQASVADNRIYFSEDGKTSWK